MSRNKAARRGLFGMAVAALSLFALSVTIPAEDISKPLIRRDLIRQSAPVFPPLKRDPFSVVAFVGEQEAFGNPSFGAVPDPAKETPPVVETAPPAPLVRFVGFLRNNKSNVYTALVLLDGAASAVSVGDTFGQGWIVLKITEKELTVQDPAGTTQVFAIQGERR
jgi:hypothetical protein